MAQSRTLRSYHRALSSHPIIGGELPRVAVCLEFEVCARAFATLADVDQRDHLRACRELLASTEEVELDEEAKPGDRRA